MQSYTYYLVNNLYKVPLLFLTKNQRFANIIISSLRIVYLTAYNRNMCIDYMSTTYLNYKRGIN